MYNFKENDWKLYRKNVPGWQERYMDKLNNEYRAILEKNNENPSTLFWNLEKRINEDKKHIGVVISMRRSTMVDNLIEMLNEDVIMFDELEDFSEDLKKEIKFIKELHNK